MIIAKWWATLNVNEKLELAKKNHIRFLSDETIEMIWVAEGKPLATPLKEQNKGK